MNFVLSDVREATPAWFDAVLDLPTAVAHVEITRIQQTNVSTVGFLHIQYKHPTNAPTRFFLKIPNADFKWGDREVDFYRRLAPQMMAEAASQTWPFIEVFDVAYDVDSGHSYILFADLSDTHFALDTASTSMPLSQIHQVQAIDAFARLHAFWWEHPQLVQRIGYPLQLADITTEIGITSQLTADFIAFMEDRLTSEQASVLTLVTSGWPKRRLARLQNGDGLTLIHRDPHALNLLYPHDPVAHQVKLIDWQSWRVDTGTDDIAYYMACHWPTEAHRKRQRPLVERYHQQLLAHGVTNYSWEDCEYDYQASICRCLFFLMRAWKPVQWERGWWWPKVKLGILAFLDLQCEAMWQ